MAMHMRQAGRRIEIESRSHAFVNFILAPKHGGTFSAYLERHLPYHARSTATACAGSGPRSVQPVGSFGSEASSGPAAALGGTDQNFGGNSEFFVEGTDHPKG